jgi:hypothetical protein
MLALRAIRGKFSPVFTHGFTPFAAVVSHNDGGVMIAA